MKFNPGLYLSAAVIRIISRHKADYVPLTIWIMQNKEGSGVCWAPTLEIWLVISVPCHPDPDRLQGGPSKKCCESGYSKSGSGSGYDLTERFCTDLITAATQGVTKICRLSWLTNSTIVYEPYAGGGLRGLSQWAQLCTRSPNKLWRSTVIPYFIYGSNAYQFWDTRLYWTWSAEQSLKNMIFVIYAYEMSAPIKCRLTSKCPRPWNVGAHEMSAPMKCRRPWNVGAHEIF